VAFDLPDDIRQFVDEIIDSFVVWDLAICFAKKPDGTGTVNEIAEMTGRSVKDVAGCLQKLSSFGLVKAHKTETEPVFEFDRTSPRSRAFQSFLNYNQFQENRLRILSHLLQKGVR